MRPTDEFALFQWLAVFPQLVCRVTHPNDTVWKLLHDIIGKVVHEYPQQAMWSIVGACHSNDLNRRKRAREILAKVKVRALARTPMLASADPWSYFQHKCGKASSSVVRSIDQASQISVYLLKLCDHPVQQKTTSLSMATSFPELAASETDFVLLPLQTSLVVNLPSNNLSSMTHNPFPADLPTIKCEYA